MKICVAQIVSKKGKVQSNIKNHLNWIHRAIQSKVDLIVFPELSITNYEPELAAELATNSDDRTFDPFQGISDKHKITIGIGMPIKVANGICISMLIFQPHLTRIIYSKKLLHSDEYPYFVSGENQPILQIKGKKVALGICYETLQRSHFLDAKEKGADIYMASVAKPDRGIDKAYLHFSAIAEEFKIPILMSNAVGYCDNFLSNGCSAVWNIQGELIGQLDEKNQGLLIYDTETEAIDMKLYC